MTRTLIVLILAIPLPAKDVYFTRSGVISFFSSAPLEDIEAYNQQVTCVLDREKGEVAFQAPIRGFTFKNAMMQEHFNENYMESDKFPKALFKGIIENWDSLVLSDSSQSVHLVGSMTIHGVTQDIKELGTIALSENGIDGFAKFQIRVVDYEIEIPKIVRKNIAAIVDVSVKVKLKKK